MPKVKISEYSATANSNTDVASINIDEGCAPSGINNAIRAVMGHLKDFQQGTYGDPFNGPVNGTVGATTPSTGTFTTLTSTSASSFATSSGNVGVGTASPTAKLQIGVASAAVDGTKGVRITNPAGTIVMLECGNGGDSFVGTESGSTFNIRTNNAINATFLTSGNVGFGETSPVQKIHFKGSGTTYALAETTGSGTSSGFRMKAGAGTDFTLFTTEGGNQFGIYNNTTSTQPLTIDASGNLGIGQTNPAKKLDVYLGTTGTVGQYLRNTTVNLLSQIDGTTSAQFGTETSHPLIFLTGNTERARIDTSGNLLLKATSIGTSAVGVIGLGNATAPTTSPAGMGQLYVEGGALKYRGSSGTVTTIAAA